jgi:gamma-glutamyltranspeptidase/glutathione hydrolase
MDETLARYPKLGALFRKPDGSLAAAGDTLRRPKLADALALLRDEGPEPFYNGAIATAIVEATRGAGGILTADDLRGYEVATRQPIVGTYRDDYTIYGMPPPSSGGVALVEIFQILEGFELADKRDAPEGLREHLLAEAFQHAFADRARWLGDADFVEIPIDRLTSPRYARELRERIDPAKTLQQAKYGTPLEERSLVQPPPDDSGTTHLSIVDGAGNMLACTSTINTSFGSKVVVEKFGLVLNNEMDDFSIQPGVPNAYGLVGSEQNAVAAGKRPLSSMSPTLVLRHNEPYMALGASGGPTIITGTALVLHNVVDREMEATEAVTERRLHHQWLPDKLFAERPDDALVSALEARGHQVISWREAYNRVQIVVQAEDGQFTGASDPRKHGRAVVVPAADLADREESAPRSPSRD